MSCASRVLDYICCWGDWRYLLYDERWRLLAEYVEDTGSADQVLAQYVYQSASGGGLDGRGGSSYIDAVMLRDRDTDVPGDGTLDERVYTLQNWRADVVGRRRP